MLCNVRKSDPLQGPVARGWQSGHVPTPKFVSLWTASFLPSLLIPKKISGYATDKNSSLRFGFHQISQPEQLSINGCPSTSNMSLLNIALRWCLHIFQWHTLAQSSWTQQPWCKEQNTHSKKKKKPLNSLPRARTSLWWLYATAAMPYQRMLVGGGTPSHQLMCYQKTFIAH